MRLVIIQSIHTWSVCHSRHADIRHSTAPQSHSVCTGSPLKCVTLPACFIGGGLPNPGTSFVLEVLLTWFRDDHIHGFKNLMSVCLLVGFWHDIWSPAALLYQPSLLFAVLRVAMHWNFCEFVKHFRLIIIRTAWIYINYIYIYMCVCVCGHHLRRLIRQQVQRTATAGTQILVKRGSHVPPTGPFCTAALPLDNMQLM